MRHQEIEVHKLIGVKINSVEETRFEFFVWITNEFSMMTHRPNKLIFFLFAILSFGLPPACLQAIQSAVDQEFVDNFDMNGDYAKHVFHADKIRVWNQSPNGFLVRSWGPAVDDEPGVLILRYRFDKPIASASVRFNLLLHRPSSHGKVEVSNDNKNYTLLTDAEQKPAESSSFQTTVFDLTSAVRGEKQVFLKVTLVGRKLNSNIVGTDFLRTAANIPKFNQPYVYEFRAKTH